MQPRPRPWLLPLSLVLVLLVSFSAGVQLERRGWRPGDVLLEVEGKPVGNLPLDQIAKMVQGPAGSVVHLRVTREGEAKVLDFRIRRAHIDVPAVSWELLPGTQIAHVALREFANKANAELRSAIDQARKRGAKGLILDVRGNPGGLRDQAVAVTSE